MKNKIKLGLLSKIIIAIIIGIAVGYVCPIWVARVFATFNYFFSQFLSFLIPLIIIGFVTPSIAELGSRSGKMLLVTAALAYAMTLFAGFGSYLTSNAIFPGLLQGQLMPLESVESAGTPEPFFKVDIPSPLPVTTALVVAFVIGLGCAYIKGRSLFNVMADVRDVVAKTISGFVIPLLPLYIFGIFLSMSAEGTVAVILTAFFKVIAVIFALHILLLLVQYLFASLFFRKNPFRMLWTMMPAYFTALGTQSSAATIPVTLKQAIKMGVREETAGFVIPLCATIHLSGSTLKIVACAIALMLLQHIPYDTASMAQFIALLGITMVAAPGIPGGAIMAALGLLSSVLGFTESQNAMMIALYIAMDSFGTACNVTGDGAIAAIVDRIFIKNLLRLQLPPKFSVK